MLHGKRMICIVGLADHGFQCRRDEIHHLSRYLEDVAKRLHADLIAEEFNADLEAMNSIPISIVRATAERLSIGYLACEPSLADRERLRIPRTSESVAANSELREQYWLEKLREVDFHAAIFLCGSDHVSSFAGRVLATGLKTQILAGNWGKEILGPRWTLDAY